MQPDMDTREKSIDLLKNWWHTWFRRKPEQNIILYLHIGLGKTGTSSIQNFMAGNNRLLLKYCSCLYPNMSQKNYLIGDFLNHMSLFKTADKKPVVKNIRRAITFCKKNAVQKLVLSAEVLFESTYGAELVRELAEIPGVDIRAIVYLRRQDTWLESSWKQWGYKTPEYRDIADYVQRRDCNWHRTLRVWEQALGKEHIIVRCYEKEQLHAGLIPDFLSAIGIDYHSHAWIDRKDIFLGFQRDVMEILFLNKDFCINNADNRLQRFFDVNLDTSFQKEPFKSYSFLSPTERIAILNRYEESNQAIARDYLGREDGVLYYESWPSQDDPWEPYQGLNIERLVPILSRILYHTVAEKK
jgi:hypothetical protein